MYEKWVELIFLDWNDFTSAVLIAIFSMFAVKDYCIGTFEWRLSVLTFHFQFRMYSYNCLQLVCQEMFDVCWTCTQINIWLLNSLVKKSLWSYIVVAISLLDMNFLFLRALFNLLLCLLNPISVSVTYPKLLLTWLIYPASE